MSFNKSSKDMYEGMFDIIFLFIYVQFYLDLGLALFSDVVPMDALAKGSYIEAVN